MRFLYEATVDEAKVTGRTRHSANGRLLEPPAFLTIAQMPEDPGYYLLYLDKARQGTTDTYHESIDAAKKQAAFEFQISPTEWRELPQ
jgi:hypothetical protein